VHTKLTIVDDRIMIIGSANCSTLPSGFFSYVGPFSFLSSVSVCSYAL
jgi:hypothetical protein